MIAAKLRPFLPADAPLLAAIFAASVEELTAEDYGDGQRAAWAAAADEPDFADGLARNLTLVATLDGAAVGFISLKGAEHIDHLYVHPGVAGRGVATLLLDAIEKLADARGAARLDVDASDSARRFFETRSFIAHRRNTVTLGDEWLGSTRMQKQLGSRPPPRMGSD